MYADISQSSHDSVINYAIDVHFWVDQTLPGIPVVSSVFFMCLPGKVLVYGDCAINSDPTSEELAAIAIASADTAAAFGIKPRVAMLSYATGDSNKGRSSFDNLYKSL